jgi:hypothetical protein
VIGPSEYEELAMDAGAWAWLNPGRRLLIYASSYTQARFAADEVVRHPGVNPSQHTFACREIRWHNGARAWLAWDVEQIRGVSADAVAFVGSQLPDELALVLR